MKRTLLLVLLCSAGLVWACEPDEGGTSPFARADELLRARDYRAASVELERVRTEIGDDPELCLRLGVAYRLVGISRTGRMKATTRRQTWRNKAFIKSN
jgi:hypothetical protein